MNGIAGLDFRPLVGWSDITDELEAGTPFTLAKVDGVGALQFSVARHKGGRQPQVDLSALSALLDEFARNQGLGVPVAVRSATGSTMIVSGDFPGKDEFIRAWYLSDGSNIALVTYTAVRADAVTRGLEAAEADAMVRSIRFEH